MVERLQAEMTKRACDCGRIAAMGLPNNDRVTTGVLAAMWLWTGVAYHALSFSAINKAAYIFAALFVVQGCCLVYAGVYRDQIRFGLRPILATGVGISLVAYAAVAYPLIGLAT